MATRKESLGVLKRPKVAMGNTETVSPGATRQETLMYSPCDPNSLAERP